MTKLEEDHCTNFSHLDNCPDFAHLLTWPTEDNERSIRSSAEHSGFNIDETLAFQLSTNSEHLFTDTVLLKICYSVCIFVSF